MRNVVELRRSCFSGLCQRFAHFSSCSALVSPMERFRATCRLGESKPFQTSNPFRARGRKTVIYHWRGVHHRVPRVTHHAFLQRTGKKQRSTEFANDQPRENKNCIMTTCSRGREREKIYINRGKNKTCKAIMAPTRRPLPKDNRQKKKS